jgi:phenylpyruvate tautomerase PptA (4-oxalocrotonate tautomerase family)
LAQIKIYGLREPLDAVKKQLSDVIHACMVEALKLPADKRFHRFLALDSSDFIYPADHSERYTIIEISMFEGRSEEAKKHLIRLLFEQLNTELKLSAHDVEITIFETPRQNWGIRGMAGDELNLNYNVKV